MVKRMSVRAALLVCALSLTGRPGAAGGAERELPELNRKVLKFAEDHLGQQVGNGECWTLAADALTHAGAQRPGAGGVGVLDFGRRLGPGEAILPGDVVQFEKARFVHKTRTGTSTHTMPHHTAIISGVKGKTITLLHQNHGGKKTVATASINLDERTEGTVEFFRPRSKKTR